MVSPPPLSYLGLGPLLRPVGLRGGAGAGGGEVREHICTLDPGRCLGHNLKPSSTAWYRMTRFVPTLRERGPNRRAVVKEKNANEAALLFSGRAINGRCVDGSPPLVMPPPVKQLAATRGIIRAKGLKIPFAKLDISNVFYTCTSPPGQASSFCRHVGVSHNAFQGLPFGRSRGPMPFPELWGLYMVRK